MNRPISKAAAIKHYAGAVADTDLVADSATFFDAAGRPTEWIVAGVAGFIVLKTTRNQTGEKLYFAAGVPIYVEATDLVATGSTATDVTAGW